MGGALAIIGNWGQFATFDQQHTEFHRLPPLPSHDSAIRKGSFVDFKTYELLLSDPDTSLLHYNGQLKFTPMRQLLHSIMQNVSNVYLVLSYHGSDRVAHKQFGFCVLKDCTTQLIRFRFLQADSTHSKREDCFRERKLPQSLRCSRQPRNHGSPNDKRTV